MDEEAVEPQAEPIEQIMENAEALAGAQEEDSQEERPDKTMVPLSALQKLREKKRELELELQWEKQNNARQTAAMQKPPEDDNSRFESATREDLKTSQEEAVRIIEEKLWIKQNPEKYERVNDNLPQFLKQRPNLASAISQASNRYEEAYELMDKLSPKQQAMLSKPTQPKKEAPNAPGSVPKGAQLNEAVDVMSMNDTEFAAWRQSKKRRR